MESMCEVLVEQEGLLQDELDMKLEWLLVKKEKKQLNHYVTDDSLEND